MLQPQSILLPGFEARRYWMDFQQLGFRHFAQCTSPDCSFEAVIVGWKFPE
jgi:hypothetical protein